MVFNNLIFCVNDKYGRFRGFIFARKRHEAEHKLAYFIQKHEEKGLCLYGKCFVRNFYFSKIFNDYKTFERKKEPELEIKEE